MSPHTCPACEREFDTRRGLGVHHTSVHGTKLPNRECAHCGHEFHCSYQKKYCSEECLDEAVSFEGENHPNWKGGKRELECEVCDATFERTPREITGEVTVCSKECQNKWISESFVGSGHPNWKGGVKVPYGKGWSATRRQALERNDYQCMICSKSKEEIGRNPDVHHITPLRLFIESEEHEKEDAHYLENVISLCVKCHRRADVGQIPKEQLQSLIGVCTIDPSEQPTQPIKS